MTVSGLYLDDGNALPVLRELINAPQAIGLPEEPKRLSCQALSRLDYATLQTMLTLRTASKGAIAFCDLDHLEEPLKRYGFNTQLLSARSDEQ